MVLDRDEGEAERAKKTARNYHTNVRLFDERPRDKNTLPQVLHPEIFLFELLYPSNVSVLIKGTLGNKRSFRMSFSVRYVWFSLQGHCHCMRFTVVDK